MGGRRRILLRFIILFFTILTNHNHEASILSTIVDSVVQSIATNLSTSDLSSNTTQLIAERGYSAEEYHVTTEDGYILTMSRIKNTTSRNMVFLMHGLFNSADDWLTLGAHALPFQLADAGYDVFLGNSRGNKYGRKHVRLSPNEKEFWNFTFHEIGVYDLPTMIDYALEISNKTQLIYVGHSQGTIVFFVMTSLKPEYNDKVSLMISMATVAWLYHEKSLVLRTLVPLRNQEVFIVESLGIYDVFAYDAFWRFITTRVCPSTKISLFVCATFLYTLYGFDYGQLNYTQFPKQIGHFPAGASVKQSLHYLQLVASKDFRQFDNKPNKNLETYGSKVPPSYPVEKITTPIAIMYGNNDLLSSFEDVKILISKLPNVIDIFRVPYDQFNHMDYLWAKGAKDLVYNKVMELITAV